MDDEIVLYVFDRSFRLVGVIDNYISLVWSERYNDLGDFELTVIYDPELKEILKKEYYVTTEITDRYCIIEKIESNKDDDGNAQMIITGRSIESILDRRLILRKLDFGIPHDEKETYKLTPYLQEAIEIILNKNCIEPEEAYPGDSERRKIPGLIFSKNNSERLNGIILEESVDKESVLDAISSICSNEHIGFKIIVNNNHQFVFSLYKGEDLTKKILFSPYYDNLNDSNYFTNDEPYKNLIYIVIGGNPQDGEDGSGLLEVNDHRDTVALIGGSTNEKGETVEWMYETTNQNVFSSGLDRREVKVDKTEMQESYETEKEYTDKVAIERAKKKLNLEFKRETAFDGSIVPDVLYSYRKDYNVGDKVMMEDEYGNTDEVYISEIVVTYDENGLSIVPTFEVVDWEWK